jgi:hypothetical protein
MLPTAIQPECFLTSALVAVSHHICHPMDLQHQPRRNFPWSRSWRSAFVYNRDCTSYSDCSRERLKICREVDGADRGIGEREWRRSAPQIRECINGGYASATIRNPGSRDRNVGCRVVMQPSRLWPLTLSPLCVTCVRGTDLCLAPMDSDPAAGDLDGPSMSCMMACLVPQTSMTRNPYRRHARSDHIRQTSTPCNLASTAPSRHSTE